MADRIPVPFYRDSAFRAWVEKSGAILAAAVIQVTAHPIPDVPWTTTLLVAGGAIVADFLGSIHAIFWGGPDVFQDPPPPSVDDQIASLKKEVADLKSKPVAIP